MKKLPSDLPLPPVTPPFAICVFCGSSHGADPVYSETARTFGKAMAAAGFDLVFGGGGVGLMGETARAVSENGGHVLGIIPNFLRHLEPPLKISSKIVITEDMMERKTRMLAAADAFAILPGGLGTLDEFSDVITGAQLRQHTKPIVLVNVKNYFAPLLTLIDHFVTEGFAGASVKDLFHVAPNVEGAMRIFIERRARQAADQAGAPAR